MTGFEPDSSGIRSDDCANYATTTGQIIEVLLIRPLMQGRGLEGWTNLVKSVNGKNEFQ